MSLSFHGHLKHAGNVNRILEMTEAGCTAAEAQECFAKHGVHLRVVNGDFPLMANLPEMTRKAVSKQAVRTYLMERAERSLAVSGLSQQL